MKNEKKKYVCYSQFEENHTNVYLFFVFFFFALFQYNCAIAKTQFHPRTKTNANDCLLLPLLFFLSLASFHVFHSRGRYITFDAVKLESIFHCTRIYFMVLFSRSALNQFYQWMSREWKSWGKKINKFRTELNTSLYSSSTHRRLCCVMKTNLILNCRIYCEIIIWLWGILCIRYL